MNIWNFIKEIFRIKDVSISETIELGTGYKNMARINEQLTKNISFFDLTRTDKLEFIDENRTVSEEEFQKLKILANLAEQVILIIGDIDKHSGRRCKKLNDAIGGTDKSQHLLCEALDLSPLCVDTENSVYTAFQKIVIAAKEGKIKFGQLIFESAQRNYGKDFWIHISLALPFRPKEKDGQVLIMKNGKYTLLETI